jgi:hypothetical protein
MTSTWRTIALLYPVLDAKYGSGLHRGRARRVMGRDERTAVESVLERLPETVSAWSDGLAAMAPLDVVEVRRPIRSLSSSGGGRWWVAPRECRDELLASVAPDRYDSVYALWPGDPEVPQCGWGCTLGPGEATYGAGFSSISTDHWRTLATDPDPEQGYVHEWLHQVESVYRSLGIEAPDLPGLHDAGEYTSTRPDDEPPFGRSYADYHDGRGTGRAPARTWSPWYRDWMTGRLRRADGSGLPARPIGLTPERWALRGR